MIFEANGIEQWFKKEGDKICYGEPLCKIEEGYKWLRNTII